MNPLLEAPSLKAETVDLGDESIGLAAQTPRITLNRGDARPLWQEAKVRTFDYRRAALERMHWRKVWRSALDG